MKTKALLVLGSTALGAGAASFEGPVVLRAAGEPIRVEAPGYAAPCLADVDGDGKKELLVGQFRDGKIKVYPMEGESFAAGTWMQAGGKVATVPGVW